MVNEVMVIGALAVVFGWDAFRRYIAMRSTRDTESDELREVRAKLERLEEYNKRHADEWRSLSNAIGQRARPPRVGRMG